MTSREPRGSKSKSRIIQYIILATLLVCAILYLSIYIFEFSSTVSYIETNTQSALTETSYKLVSSYTVNMDGSIDGELVLGDTFTSSTDKLVLVSRLPEQSDGFGLLLSDGTLVCKSVSSFACNYLIGSRLLIVTFGLLLLSTVVAFKRNIEYIIISSVKVRILVYMLTIISLCLSLVTYGVLS